MANRWTNPIWTPEAIAFLERLIVIEKKSFGTAAAELQKHGFKVTRSGCVGKARRMKISSGREPGTERGAKKPRKKQQPTVARANVRPHLPRYKLELVCEPIVTPPPPPKNNRTGNLIDLDADQCRWPVTGGRPPFKFCTEDHIKKSAYCAHHHRKAHQQ